MEPPDPEMRRAALAGSPQSQADNGTEEFSLAASDFQARSRKIADEYETFDDDERIAHAHAEYFGDEYLEELFDLGAVIR
jgi:hypothetical protein